MVEMVLYLFLWGTELFSSEVVFGRIVTFSTYLALGTLVFSSC